MVWPRARKKSRKASRSSAARHGARHGLEGRRRISASQFGCRPPAAGAWSASESARLRLQEPSLAALGGRRSAGSCVAEALAPRTLGAATASAFALQPRSSRRRRSPPPRHAQRVAAQAMGDSAPARWPPRSHAQADEASAKRASSDQRARAPSLRRQLRRSGFAATPRASSFAARVRVRECSRRTQQAAGHARPAVGSRIVRRCGERTPRPGFRSGLDVSAGAARLRDQQAQLLAQLRLDLAAISGCSLRYWRALSLPWPMRSPL